MNKLSEKAVLIDLTLGRWEPTKYDTAAAARTAANDGVSAEMVGAYRKPLLAPRALAEITSIDTAWGRYHRSVTNPWTDRGPRVLSVIKLDEYRAKAQEFSAARQAAVLKFVQAYPELREDARRGLGATQFNEQDYPAASDIAARFHARYVILPFPDTGHFLAVLTAEEIAATEAAISAAMDAGVLDILKRMHDVVEHMAERLRAYKPPSKAAGKEQKTENRFHDTLVSNVYDLLMLIPALNITGNPEVTRVAREMVELIKHDPDTLRESDTARTETASKAESILTLLNSALITLPESFNKTSQES